MTDLVPGDFELARQALGYNGGPNSQADLARRWGVSRQRVNQLVRDPTFPEPVGQVNGAAVYLFDECDRWRRRRQCGLYPLTPV